MAYIVCFLVTFLSCGIGTICGMGGGIIIKPVLDATGIMSVAAITFLSGVTVICMTSWTLGKTFLKKESVIDIKNTTILAITAASGGFLGKELFRRVAALFEDPNTAGGVQACFLFAATLATFLYTRKKDEIKSRETDSILMIAVLGFGLGVFGAFLGIGGGPFNVALLFYFFNMQTKKAAQNSLYIILFSQMASTCKTILSKGIPEFSIVLLIGMIILGIAGSEIGRRINKKIDDKIATKCLLGSMILIMCINLYNIFKFFVL